MDGWLLADSNGVENQNQRPFYVGRRSVARARVNSLICLMVDREQSLSPDPYIPPHFIWKSGDPSLPLSAKKNPTARTLAPAAAAMKMRDRGEYERKNPSPLIQQQFLSQSNFADCPVNLEEVYFLCSFNRSGGDRPKIRVSHRSSVLFFRPRT